MARTAITSVHTCAVCRKKTTRLLGFYALVNLASDTGGRASRHTAVLGTCAAHREQIPALFAADAAAKGEAVWVCDEPFMLRPDQVEDWYASIDRTFAETLTTAGIAPAGGALIPVHTPDGLPRNCPHCGGELSWGTGPHVADAEARGNAFAWECLGCGSAGLLQLTKDAQ